MPDSSRAPTEDFPWSLPSEPLVEEYPGYFPSESPKRAAWSRKRIDVVAGLVGLLVGLGIGIAGGSALEGKQFSADEVDTAVAGAVKDAEREFASRHERADAKAAHEIARLRAEVKSQAARAKAADRVAKTHQRNTAAKEPAAREPESSLAFSPAPGWTTDALTPGYTGCRQGYPGGRVNGVYVWRPIPC